MKENCNKWLRATLSFVLVLCLLLGALSNGVAVLATEIVQRDREDFDYAPLGDNIENEEPKTVEYHLIPESSYYVALGERIKPKDQTDLPDTYVDLLSKELGVAYEDASSADTIDHAPSILDALDYVNNNSEIIAKADLITIGYGSAGICQKATKVMVNALLKLNYVVEFDWLKYVDETTLAHMEDELSAMRDKLISQGLDKTYPGGSGLTFADALVLAAEAYLYEVMVFVTTLPKLVDTIRQTNSDAVIVLLGISNPLEGVMLSFEGTQIGVDAYFDYATAETKINGVMRNLQNAKVIYVAVPDTESAVRNQTLEVGIALIANFKKGTLHFYPSDNGHIYIRDQIMSSLKVGHTAADAVIENRVEATCTATGSYDEVVYCTGCSFEFSREQKVIPTADHMAADAVIENKVEATCTADGSYEEVVYCVTCSLELSRESKAIPTDGHTAAEVVIENLTESDCENVGHYDEVVYCRICDYEMSRTTKEIPARNHVIVTDSALAPTCTTTGLTEGQHCGVCDIVLLAQQIIPALGHDEVAHDGMAASCTEKGWEAYVTCSRCDYTSYQEIAALGHRAGEAKNENVHGATCGEAGSYDRVVYCLVCEAELSRETITVSATEQHNFVTEVENKPATCTEDGKVIYACSCGEMKEEIIPAKGHTEVVDAAVEASCTNPGKTEGKHCSICNTVLLSQITVEAKGHTEVVDAAVQPTCTTDGLTAGKHCAVCGIVIQAQKVISAAGHMEVLDPAVAPTCTTTGLTSGKHCSACNAVTVAQTVISALGHKESNPVRENVKDATCGTTGSYESVVYCAVCEEELSCKIIMIAPSGNHNYAIIVEEECVEATCTTEGKQVYTCCCGATEEQIVPAKGHREVINPAVAATCTEPGQTEEVHCSVCEIVLVPKTVMPALGHHYIATETAPSCTEPGYTTHTCDRCGDTYQDNQTNALGHSYVGGICERCGDAHLLGDVNGDGKVNSTDAKLIMQYELKIIGESQLDLIAADVNGDGKINTTDAKLVMQFELKIISRFPTTK